MCSVANSASEQSSFIHFLFAHHVNLLLCKTVDSIAQLKKKNVGGNSQAMFTRSAKGEGGQNLLKRILRLCSDPHWQTDLVIQEPEHLCQCVLENQEQESTPLESSTTFLSANWCIGETSLKVSSQ